MPISVMTKAARAMESSAPRVASRSWNAPYSTTARPHQLGRGLIAISSSRRCQTMKPAMSGTKKPWLMSSSVLHWRTRRPERGRSRPGPAPRTRRSGPTAIALLRAGLIVMLRSLDIIATRSAAAALTQRSQRKEVRGKRGGRGNRSESSTEAGPGGGPVSPPPIPFGAPLGRAALQTSVQAETVRPPSPRCRPRRRYGPAGSPAAPAGTAARNGTRCRCRPPASAAILTQSRKLRVCAMVSGSSS